MKTYAEQLDAKLDRLGRCKCWHMAYHHWHGGPIKDLEIQDCGQ